MMYQALMLTVCSWFATRPEAPTCGELLLEHIPAGDDDILHFFAYISLVAQGTRPLVVDRKIIGRHVPALLRALSCDYDLAALKVKAMSAALASKPRDFVWLTCLHTGTIGVTPADLERRRMPDRLFAETVPLRWDPALLRVELEAKNTAGFYAEWDTWVQAEIDRRHAAVIKEASVPLPSALAQLTASFLAPTPAFHDGAKPMEQ